MEYLRREVYFGQEAINLFADEGNLRDRALRGAIEGKIRHFFECIDEENWKEITRHLASDAKLLARLLDPSDIYSGIQSIVARLKNEVASGQKTVHKLLIVDRGRVTCYVAQFWMHQNMRSTFFESREVYVIDIDDRHQFKRIEIRDHDRERMQHDGDEEMMKKAVKRAEMDAMRLIDRI
ncbi:hypothetical protein CTA2_4527 [Colletotrichum tanaceti]|uniref:Uncharacterized protein n=1 Tax=Colletotrichum tanaceti TaxID=1306861 RepID=A0A4U6X4Z8_9PEZI|nr:hypothetical protein CTA2_4527 [Colletotrichum tanaceti]TKW50023.1 hypothetical protein CTA1_7199 [Colletotrichum tanaceti]